MSNYQSSFHVIDLKLDIETSLPIHRCSVCIAASSAVVMYRIVDFTEARGQAGAGYSAGYLAGYLLTTTK